MNGYFIFVLLCAVLLLIADITRKLGYKNLKVYRNISNSTIYEGETFDVTVVVENNKWIPISFLYVCEKLPAKLEVCGAERSSEKEDGVSHITKYNILWYERIRRTYSIKAQKRGSYLLRSINLTLGDMFGFSAQSMEIEDFIEVLVLPKLIDVNELIFENNSLMGESFVKRWIYKDPLYIRGIREYNVEDRMKDIHWKSSLKMNKLMVKDYDYTADNEVIIISNVQIDDQLWRLGDTDISERIIKVSASFAAAAIKEHIPTGFWTNAYVRSFYDEYKCEIQPSLNSFKNIMELAARMDVSAKIRIEDYIINKAASFKKNCSYILVTAYMNEACMNIINKLKNLGMNIVIIDVSKEGNLPDINGVVRLKLMYEGGIKE